MRTVRVGLLGLGVVGSAVAKAILDDREMSERSGIHLELAKVAVRDISKKRAVDVAAELLTTDPAEVVNDPQIDVVVELIGGENPAFELITTALSSMLSLRIKRCLPSVEMNCLLPASSLVHFLLTRRA
jgi:homoserine dehydrogenase